MIFFVYSDAVDTKAGVLSKNVFPDDPLVPAGTKLVQLHPQQQQQPASAPEIMEAPTTSRMAGGTSTVTSSSPPPPPPPLLYTSTTSTGGGRSPTTSSRTTGYSTTPSKEQALTYAQGTLSFASRKHELYQAQITVHTRNALT